MTTEVDATGVSPSVTVYWRPGCPYCTRLRRGLRRAGVEAEEVDIWGDPEAAAVVRRAARGNETVPTVAVGERFLVNPSVAEVLSASQGAATGRPATARGRRLSAALPAVQWGVVVALLMTSFTLEGSGHVAASWGLDAVAAVVYFLVRLLRHRMARGELG